MRSSNVKYQPVDQEIDPEAAKKQAEDEKHLARLKAKLTAATLESSTYNLEEEQKNEGLLLFQRSQSAAITAFNKKLSDEALAKKELDKPGIMNSIKRGWNYCVKKTASLRDTLLTTADLGGTVGFVANIILTVNQMIILVGEGIAFFLGVVASPLAFSAIITGIMLETYAISQDAAIKQRKTRYAANALMVACLAMAMAIAVGAFAAAPPFSIPLLFLGLVGAGYIKDGYILKQTNKEIDAEITAIASLRKEMLKAINHAKQNNIEIRTLQSRLTAANAELLQLSNIKSTPETRARSLALRNEIRIHQIAISDILHSDPRVKRIAMDLNDRQDRLDGLKVPQGYLQTAQSVRKVSFLAIGLLIAGGFAMFAFPPLGAAMLVVGALAILATVLLNTYLRYEQMSKTKKDAQAIKDRDHDQHDKLTIQTEYARSLTLQQTPNPTLAGSTLVAAAGLATQTDSSPRRLLDPVRHFNHALSGDGGDEKLIARPPTPPEYQQPFLNDEPDSAAVTLHTTGHSSTSDQANLELDEFISNLPARRTSKSSEL